LAHVRTDRFGSPKGDPDDETSGEDTLETDGGDEALEGTAILPKNEP
jgi:hypothetical protein